MIEAIASPRNEDSEGAARPLKITVYLADQNPARDRSLGITTMTQSVMDQFAAREDVRVTQIVSRTSFNAAHSSFETRTIPLRTDRPIRRLLSDGLHPLFMRHRADVWYYPKGYAPRFSLPDAPVVGTMHDVIVQHYADHYPQTRSRFAFRYWISSIRRSLRQFTHVLTVSQHAAGQLRQFCDRYRIDPPQIDVTYEGSAWENYRDMQFEKRDRVVHLCSKAVHKGTGRLLAFWQTLQSRGCDLPQLMLVGELDPECLRIAQGLSGVSVHARLGLEALRDVVGQSRALLLPSEIEGFGLPAIEAYYVGTPVSYVQGTSVDEILNLGRDNDDDDLPGGFSLDDVDSFQHSLEQVIAMSDDKIQATSTRLYNEFQTGRIAGRLVEKLRQAAGC